MCPPCQNRRNTRENILDSDLGGTIEPSQNREYFESTAISWMSCSNDSLVQNRG